MKKLLVVESPAKIKTISKFLGKDYVIMSTMGHVKDLPTNKLGVTMSDSAIELDYVPLEKKDKVLADIAKEARKADEIYLAPDPDREGEIIAWHVEGEVLKVVKNPEKIHRISFNEITKEAVEAALAHPREVDLSKVSAQQARRVLDRWVGYEVSPVLWRKLTKGLSAGRVQSVALKLICDREEAIKSFKPEESWSIEPIFLYKSTQIPATLTHIGTKKADITTEKVAKEVVEKIKQVSSFIISSIKDSARSKNAPPPFMTSTLQQAAYNQLGFSVDKTMQIAQKLYEGIPLEDKSTPVALITYMRTDSLRLAESAVTAARSFIKKEYGADYVPAKTQVYAKGKAQDAHEAIRPISVTVTPEQVARYLEPAAAKLYALIWKRFVACQMKAAQYAQRQVLIEGGNFTFKATGSTLTFDGFLKVYIDSEDEDSETKTALPADLTAQQPVTPKEITPKQHFTQPPPRFTQASLVKELEKEGIGRPSTYATIMKTIQARSYTALDAKKRFVPTDLGNAVTKLLTEHLPDIMNVKFTAVMEENLDKIAQGELERDKLLRDFYTAFSKDLKKFAGESVPKQVEETNVECPDCKQSKLVIRFGKAGAFLGCPRFPECKFTSNFERSEDGAVTIVAAQAPQLLEENCPQCTKPLRNMVGRYGPFISCSGYPECKYIHQTKAQFPCPDCKGEIIKRSWRGKTFWGCKSYPKCKFSIAGDIEQQQCPQCKTTPYLLKKELKSGTTVSCPTKDCGYTNTAPHEEA